ncbi:hypothetical protein [Mycobacterium sp. URHB0021]
MSQLLPKARATWLLAEVENSARLPTNDSDGAMAALAELDRLVATAVAAHGGVRSVAPGEDTSFVAVFEDAGDAVECALGVLQQKQRDAIRLRIGVHTAHVPRRCEGGLTVSAINCAALLRDLAHGGQVLLSGTTEELVAHQLPDQTWLVHLGRYQLGDQCGPERVSRLCHPDLPNEAPSVRAHTVATRHLPVQLTSFVGREAAITDLRRILAHDQVVTLVGCRRCGQNPPGDPGSR